MSIGGRFRAAYWLTYLDLFVGAGSRGLGWRVPWFLVSGVKKLFGRTKDRERKGGVRMKRC